MANIKFQREMYFGTRSPMFVPVFPGRLFRMEKRKFIDIVLAARATIVKGIVETCPDLMKTSGSKAFRVMFVSAVKY